MGRPHASILTRLTNLPLLVLAGVNVWMVVGFWGQLGGGDPLPYQLFGACLAAVEVTFLVVAADAQTRREVAKARIWRGVFAVVLCLNLVADFGAIVTKTKSDQLERSARASAYDAAQRSEAEASAELSRLENTLRDADLLLPTAAIEARFHGVEERRARYERQGLRSPRALVQELAMVEQGLAVSRRADEVRLTRDDARRRLLEFGTRPETSNAQIQGLVELAGILGLRMDGEAVRVVLAAALALVGKLVLVFGFWAVTPRLANGGPPDAAGVGELDVVATERRLETAPPTGEGPNPFGTERAPTPRRSKGASPADPIFERAIDDLENGVV